jgi:hypothetical protein
LLWIKNGNRTQMINIKEVSLRSLLTFPNFTVKEIVNV